MLFTVPASSGIFHVRPNHCSRYSCSSNSLGRCTIPSSSSRCWKSSLFWSWVQKVRVVGRRSTDVAFVTHCHSFGAHSNKAVALHAFRMSNRFMRSCERCTTGCPFGLNRRKLHHRFLPRFPLFRLPTYFTRAEGGPLMLPACRIIHCLYRRRLSTITVSGFMCTEPYPTTLSMPPVPP